MEFCKKHPKYRGHGKPKHECLKCLSLYSQIGMKRKPISPPNKIISSKKEKQSTRQKLKQKLKTKDE